jgi:hypothetical protein
MLFKLGLSLNGCSVLGIKMWFPVLLAVLVLATIGEGKCNVNNKIIPFSKCCTNIKAIFQLWDSTNPFTGYEGIFPWR